MASPIASPTGNLYQNAAVTSITDLTRTVYFRDSVGRRIGVQPPRGYRSVSCSIIASDDGVRTSFPTLLLVKSETARSRTGLCRMPGIRLRDMFDSEMTFSIGLKPLFQYTSSSGQPVSVHRVPAGSSLAPAGYLVAWLMPQSGRSVAITYPPSHHRTATAVASSIIISSVR